jgi:hypothetical protein
MHVHSGRTNNDEFSEVPSGAACTQFALAATLKCHFRFEWQLLACEFMFGCLPLLILFLSTSDFFSTGILP